ncbi:hypothetical protein RBI22_01360 [Alcaligenaceae bacterium C4P045]|nr:hypothetical protein [Alcaligenaceae bacterium C4P045]
MHRDAGNRACSWLAQPNHQEIVMSEKIRATLAIDKTTDGKFIWVVTAVEGDIGTMPRIERATTGYATEDEARRAGEQQIEKMRAD